MAEAQCNGEGRREVSTDLSWMFGLSRKGSKKINMLWGHGYLRFSMSTFSLVSQLCWSPVVMKRNQPEKTPCRRNVFVAKFCSTVYSFPPCYLWILYSVNVYCLVMLHNVHFYSVSFILNSKVVLFLSHTCHLLPSCVLSWRACQQILPVLWSLHTPSFGSWLQSVTP